MKYEKNGMDSRDFIKKYSTRAAGLKGRKGSVSKSIQIPLLPIGYDNRIKFQSAGEWGMT